MYKFIIMLITYKSNNGLNQLTKNERKMKSIAKILYCKCC